MARSTSPYLEASLARSQDRGDLIRRDVDLMLEGLSVKVRFLHELSEQISRHRRDDSSQLKEARQEAWSQWDERLKRLDAWIANGAVLGQSAGRLHEWGSSVSGLDHAFQIAQRYSTTLEPKLTKLEKDLLDLGEAVARWSDRLLLKESELRSFIEREKAKGAEVFVSSARKRPYLDFLYAEREEEGRLSREFKKIRGAANHALERFARAEKWVTRKSQTHLGDFEIHKNQLMGTWHGPQKRFQALREGTLAQALAFEEGRVRLRWIYDTVQSIRVVQESPARPKPLLERLFNPHE